MVWTKAVGAAMAVAIASTGCLVPAAYAHIPDSTLSRAKDDLAPLLKARTLVAGDTWRQKVKVKGYKQIKLQLKQGSGPFKTVKTYKVPKSGKVKLSRTFPTPGGFSMRSIAVPEGKGRPVKGKPFIITVVAKRYAGTFGGEDGSGTSWDGSITYFYQERDPITNQPWGDDSVHYTGIEGTVTWRYNASVLNGSTRRNCSASPDTGQLSVDSLSAFVTVDQSIDREYKGRRYSVDVNAQQTPRIQYTCDYRELDENLNEIWVPETRETSLQFGPNGGDLLTNGLSVNATGVAGQYTKSLSDPLVGDVNRPPESLNNRWYWNLTPS
ncbi:MAG: hypothetical protein MUE31_12700 [Candidatus Nanopelagicales bacterium]|jgi:hypothetical protein|nr:hypothetical protein [Candidatus Nanopelagicales bacterium]